MHSLVLNQSIIIIIIRLLITSACTFGRHGAPALEAGGLRRGRRVAGGLHRGHVQVRGAGTAVSHAELQQALQQRMHFFLWGWEDRQVQLLSSFLKEGRVWQILHW